MDETSAVTSEILRTTIVKKTFQAIGQTSSGSGAATVEIQVSNVNDPNAFIIAGTITLTLSTTLAKDGFTVDSAWVYVRAKITSITGTGSTVSVIMGL